MGGGNMVDPYEHDEVEKTSKRRAKGAEHVRPEVCALIARGNVTLDEWKTFRGNSFEFEALMPALTDDAIAHVARHYVENSFPNTKRPCVTYNDAIAVVLVPELLRRLGQ